MRFADWLALREPADAAARAADLLERVPMPAGATVVDLGSGTGSMARWVAARRPDVGRWVLVDRDASLLASAYGLPGSVSRRAADLGEVSLDGASLVTASALLDMLTRAELARLVDRCVAAGCPALVTLSVVGSVTLTPADPLDAAVEAAFNAHQRRGSLLGPDAVDAAVELFAGHGVPVEVRDSPWRLGAGALTEEWFRGWLGAAVEQEPGLDAAAYGTRRLAAIRSGDVEVVVGHRDLLAGG